MTPEKTQPKPLTEEALEGLLMARGIQAPRHGWLKTMRMHEKLSTRKVGLRLGVSHQAVSQFESAELRGAITLINLRRMAKAMDCDLVWGIVPKKKPTPMPLPGTPDYGKPGTRPFSFAEMMYYSLPPEERP